MCYAKLVIDVDIDIAVVIAEDPPRGFLAKKTNLVFVLCGGIGLR